MILDFIPTAIVDQSPALIVIIPLMAAIFIGLFGFRNPKLAQPIVVIATGGSLLSSLVTLQKVLSTGPISYHLGGWVPPIGIEYAVDHLNAPVLTLVAAVSLLTALYSKEVVKQETPDRIPSYYILFILVVTGMLGITITGDAFNLYVLLEIAALTTYALVALAGGRAYMATFNYIILGTIGAGLYLLGVGYLLIKTGSLNMADLGSLLVPLYSGKAVLAAFILTILGIWIKMAFFPLHGWLPNAYSYAPTATSCLLAPLMTKVSVYVMIRVMFTIFSAQYTFEILGWQNTIVWWSVVAIVAGSLFALAQKTMKKMLTYIVVSEIGYMVGGVWLANKEGITGATYHIFSDSTMTLCLFMVIGCICYRTRDDSFQAMNGLFRRMPITMALFIVGAFSMIGIPPTCGFFSKWYLISGGIQSGQWLFVAALVFSSLINAVLFFRLIEIGYYGNLKNHAGHHEENIAMEEAPASMLIPTAIVAIGLIIIGLYTNEIVTNLIEYVIPAGL